MEPGKKSKAHLVRLCIQSRMTSFHGVSTIVIVFGEWKLNGKSTPHESHDICKTCVHRLL
jgi:hypothetical protein